MSVDSVLLTALQTLYPTIKMNYWALTAGIALIVFAALMLLIVIITARYGDTSDVTAFLVTGFIIAFGAIGCNIIDNVRSDYRNRLVNAVVNDRAALTVINDLKKNIDWINNPSQQRNKEEK